MNNKRRILSGLFSLFLLLGSVPAWAVSFNSSWCGPVTGANRFNTAGTTFANMTPRNTTFCYLSSISFEDIDTGGEEATCQVT